MMTELSHLQEGGLDDFGRGPSKVCMECIIIWSFVIGGVFLQSASNGEFRVPGFNGSGLGSIYTLQVTLSIVSLQKASKFSLAIGAFNLVYKPVMFEVAAVLPVYNPCRPKWQWTYVPELSGSVARCKQVKCLLSVGFASRTDRSHAPSAVKMTCGSCCISLLLGAHVSM